MANRKQIILLTGTTCAGKSTIMEAMKLIGPPDIMLIPQVTTRQPRTDDDSSLFVYKDILCSDELFLHNKELSYGISKQSISDFIVSDCSTAVMIAGTDEIEMLNENVKKQNLSNIDYNNVLITHSHNYQKEVLALKKCLPIYFDKENTQKRFNYFKEHIKNKLLNDDFINKNINLHLTRELSLIKWAYELSRISKISPSKIIYALDKQITESNKQPKVYISPEKKVAISQIIMSLKNNKKQI